MPFNLEGIKKYISECNITVKGVLHVGSQNDIVRSIYNSINVNDNNIIWVESDRIKAARNIGNGAVNCFTTIIDEPTSATLYYSEAAVIRCNLECCIGEPQLILSELENTSRQTLHEFLTKNNFDPAEFNFWNFDSIGKDDLRSA